MTSHTAAVSKPFLEALAGKRQARPPFWLMRQAGRYLPEYRATRAEAGSFLDLCTNPKLACEVTIQPLRRYGMDAAILFSDILIVPWALGQHLEFAEGEGPRLHAIRDVAGMKPLSLSRVRSAAAPIFETVSRIRAELDRDWQQTALIGFAGSPWTIACYMVEGQGSKDYHHVKGWAFRDPDGFGALIDMIVEATIDYLSAQVEAGAETLQLFDSWAGALGAAEFRRWSIEPTKRIVTALHAKHPGVPIIGFPRQAGLNLEAYARETGVDAVSLDPAVPLDWAAKNLQPHLTVQGNLEPLLLLTGGAALDAGVADILETLGSGPFIFNLGHGIIKETPPEHVTRLTALIRGTT